MIWKHMTDTDFSGPLHILVSELKRWSADKTAAAPRALCADGAQHEQGTFTDLLDLLPPLLAHAADEVRVIALELIAHIPTALMQTEQYKIAIMRAFVLLESHEISLAQSALSNLAKVARQQQRQQRQQDADGMPQPAGAVGHFLQSDAMPGAPNKTKPVLLALRVRGHIIGHARNNM